ncbi:MAG: hypothetical protein KDE46_02665, partial [Caldilineaceae bacterium]|nr:hypothetical protein [Caldilineaceae bacterium]
MSLILAMMVSGLGAPIQIARAEDSTTGRNIYLPLANAGPGAATDAAANPQNTPAQGQSLFLPLVSAGGPDTAGVNPDIPTATADKVQAAATSTLLLRVISARTEPRAFSGAGVSKGDPITEFKYIINIDNSGTT